MITKPRLQALVRKLPGLLLNVLLFAAVLLAVSAFQARDMLSTSGTMAPPLNGPMLDGGHYDIATVEDRPVVIYFFAPWCRICAASSDNLTRLRRWRDEEALEILAVAIDWQTHAEVRDYVERHEIGLPVILGSRQTAADWRIRAFPTYYVLDSEKRIRRRDLGYSTQLGLFWRTWLVD